MRLVTSMVRHPFGESVVLHRFKEHHRNAHGQAIKVFHPDEPIDGVAVAPYGQTEPEDGLSERSTHAVKAYVGPGVGVTPADEITVRGVRFAVDGAVSGDWANPFTGRTPGAEIRLKKVVG